MVVATTITQVGDHMLKIVVTGLAADTNAGDEVDIHDYDIYKWDGYPNRVVLQAARTAGTTDVVAVELLASNITAVYAVTQGVVSAVSSTGSDWVEEDAAVPPARYWKIYTTTVGAGNTLTATAILDFRR
jgi:hypothetical protein